MAARTSIASCDYSVIMRPWYPWTCLLVMLVALVSFGHTENYQKTRTVPTKYGQLRGFYRSVPGYGRVATYLGVPYATPPVGANRFSPTRTLSQWVGVHEASHFGPACPQKLPDITNETQALNTMSRGKLQALRRYLPALKHQSEDCLYLNLYVPDEEGQGSAYPVVVFVHGESYQWGSSTLYDGSVLATLGRVIVVTINYRLGILGFFNPNVDPVGRATVANYGLMDQLAALHWVQENIVRFGGDPGHVTVMGHGTGAACLNFLLISPAATGLFKRAILMSGSALSPWALVQEPVYYAVQAARQLGCEVPDDLYQHYKALLHCFRDRTVEQILQVNIEVPQFLSAVGPSVDGVTIRHDWKNKQAKMGKEGRTPVELLLGVTATDVLQLFSDTEIQHGFEADHRDRLIRTFVNNNYHYHLQEIVLAVTAEYTDWSRSVQHPVNIRDLTGEALHDACYVSPATISANQLYSSGRPSYLYVLDYRPNDPDPVSGPDLILNELVYVLGSPLGAQGPLAVGLNFTNTEVALSEAIITFWTNFIKTGNPNDSGSGDWWGPGVTRDRHRYRTHNWTRYDPVHRRYLELGSRGRVKEHYRADRVALWSWLVPGLEQVGSKYGPDSPFHRLPNYLQPDTFSGPTRPTNLSSNFLPPPTTTPLPTTTTPATTTHLSTPPTHHLYPNTSGVQGPMEKPSSKANIQQFPYTTALSLTVAIGCSLLILNLLVFAAVYYRRDNPRHPFHKTNHEVSSDSGNDVHLQAPCDPCKAMSPSHYGTLRSSATLRSSLATSFESEWPPNYTASCHQSSEEPTLCTSTGQCHANKPHNGTLGRRPIQRQALTTYSPHIDTQLSPISYTHEDTSDMHV